MTQTLTRTETTTVALPVATLLAAAKDAAKATTDRNATVLAGIRLEVQDGVLALAAFNYDTAVRRTTVVDGDSLPPTLVHGKTLLASLAKLDTKGRVSLSVVDDKFLLAQDAKRVNLPTLPLADYPNMPPIPADYDLVTTGADVRLIADKVTPCAGKDDMLPVLTGVHLSYDDHVLTASATDRFRLAMLDVPVAGQSADPWSALVPNMAAIGAILGDTGIVQVTVRDGWVHLDAGGAVVSQRLLDGEFPRVRSLFPVDIRTRTSFEPLGFLKSLKFVASGVERNTAIQVEVDATTVTLATGPDCDVEMSDVVPANTTEQLDGEFRTGFNPALLESVVKVFGKGHDVTLSNAAPSKPSVFTSESVPNLRVLLMPRRLTS